QRGFAPAWKARSGVSDGSAHGGLDVTVVTAPGSVLPGTSKTPAEVPWSLTTTAWAALVVSTSEATNISAIASTAQRLRPAVSESRRISYPPLSSYVGRRRRRRSGRTGRARWWEASTDRAASDRLRTRSAERGSRRQRN